MLPVFKGDSPHKLSHLISDGDLIQDWLKDKRSPVTRREYQKDLAKFFHHTYGLQPTTELVSEFLGLERFAAITLVLRYKAYLVAAKLSANTINRRLAALKSMVNFARQVGKCNFDLNDISSEQGEAYRDTTGISLSDFQKMLGTVNRSTVKGKRDYAILVLLWTNALRRAELVALNLADLDWQSAQLKIYGKGKGNQSQQVSLSGGAMAALQDWLSARSQELYAPCQADSPLFISVNDGYRQRLSVTTIYQIVRRAGEKAGIEKIISPHRIRHSSITTALDQTNGNVRAVQKLSRHSNLNTLMIYDDNRQNQQKEMSDLLDSLI